MTVQTEKIAYTTPVAKHTGYCAIVNIQQQYLAMTDVMIFVMSTTDFQSASLSNRSLVN